MPQFSYPGVYVQEKSSGVKTITGVSTSIASFIGRAIKGQMNKPVRCFSYGDYIRTFGASHPKSDLALNVRQFFDNGGTDCYVVRIAKGAAKANLSLTNDLATAVLDVTAKAEGLWGAGLRLEVDYNTPMPDETFTLRVYHEQSGDSTLLETHAHLSMNAKSSRYVSTYVSQNSTLIDVKDNAGLAALATASGYSESRRPVGNQAAWRTLINTLIAAGSTSFNISINGSVTKTVTLGTLPVAAAAEITNLINAEFASEPGIPAVEATIDGDYLKITAKSASIGASNDSVRIMRASSSDIAAALMLGVDQGGIEPAKWSNLRPSASGAVLTLNKGGAVGSIATARLDALSALRQNAVTSIRIDGKLITLNLVTDPPGGTSLWSDNKPSAATVSDDNDGVREKLRIIAEAINADPLLKYRAEAYGYHLSIIAKQGNALAKPVLSDAAAALLDAININDRRYALTGGSDGDAPGIVEYQGNEVLQTGLYSLDGVDLINLMVLPRDEEVNDSQMTDIQGLASIYCQSRRAFLLMDAPRAWTNNATGRPDVVQDGSKVNDVRAKVVKDHSGIFYPNLMVNDRGILRSTGPAGAVAGLFSRTDAERGVWKAPAGVEADFRGISGFQVKLTDRENGVLNKLGVNCLRTFPSGFVSWGARTMAGLDDLGSEWKYIPIRRLALFLQESLYRGTQWAVFEPNDEPLWAKIRLNIGAFMNGLFRQGAFQGSTPSEAFYVRCDKDTTTQNDRNLGIVNVEIGFAPLKPAEFVVITIQQMAGDLK